MDTRIFRVCGPTTAAHAGAPGIFGDRAELTDEEFAELLRQAEQIRASGGDALFGDGFLGAVISGEVRSYDPSTGNYDAAWMVDRNMENRTSLIIDPPNGRLPPMTEEGRHVRRHVPVAGSAPPTVIWAARCRSAALPGACLTSWPVTTATTRLCRAVRQWPSSRK